jgi:hypothetical protein
MWFKKKFQTRIPEQSAKSSKIPVQAQPAPSL